MAQGFQQAYLRRGPLGGAVKGSDKPVASESAQTPTRPASVEEVARFWSSFRTARDLAIVGLMLLPHCGPPKVLG